MPAKNNYIKFAGQNKAIVGRRKKPFLENIVIEDIGSEGKAIAHENGKVIFVPYGIPGDVVDIQVSKSRNKYYEGFITQYHKSSDLREKAFCRHFGTCGGCKWQELPYQKQLEYKHKQVIDTIERIGKVTGYDFNPILQAPQTTHYRNKLEFTFSDSRWLTKEELSTNDEIAERKALGFHISGRFDKILDIETCFLQEEPSNSIRLEVKRFAEEHNLSFFNLVKQEGWLRNLIIRTTTTGEVMTIFSFFHEDQENRMKLLDHIQKTFPEITSLLYVINEKKNETLFDQDILVYKGKDHIIEQLDGLSFRIGPKSFFQTNTKQAENLYQLAYQMAEPQKNDVIFDLYAGTGTITNYMARYCKKAIGVELIPEAIDDALINAGLNHITNIEFYAGDVKDILTEPFMENYGKPDIIVVDPPRAGLSNDVIDILLKIHCEKIIYISCNPATQARDIALLSAHYSVDKIQPVDMFPHTHHVENIAKLTMKKNG